MALTKDQELLIKICTEHFKRAENNIRFQFSQEERKAPPSIPPEMSHVFGLINLATLIDDVKYVDATIAHMLTHPKEALAFIHNRFS